MAKLQMPKCRPFCFLVLWLTLAEFLQYYPCGLHKLSFYNIATVADTG